MEGGFQVCHWKPYVGYYREQKLGVYFRDKRRKMQDLNLKHPHDIPAPNCLTTLPPPSLFDESQVNILSSLLEMIFA